MSSKNNLFLTIIIPCYNEEKNLKGEVLKEVYNYLRTKKFSWEVIISDDGSSDESREVIKSQTKNLPGFMLIENPHGGKPSALWGGVKEAKGEYILFSDMDQSTPIDELNKLIPFLDKNYQVIIGSRGLRRKDFPLYRKLGATVFSTFRRLLILSEIKDTQCGFKLFERRSLIESFPKIDYFKQSKQVVGWKVTSFDVELLHILKKMGCKIKEVRVLWQDKDISTNKGGAIEKYLKESMEMFMQILRVKINDLRGLY